jgi:hypothetical protein
MATYDIDVPGDDDVTLNVGDTLNISFVQDCRFCSPESASTYFDPALPNGDHNKDTSWSGVAQSAGDDQSVNHHSVGKAVDCASRVKRSPTRTIQIGDGKE